MPTWKVLAIGVLTCICIALGTATIAIPISQDGNDRWAWLGGLVLATACAGTALAFFMRYASKSLDQRPRTGRN
jgi:uncharacterized membrane protein YbhN (UPF0104 family)